MEPPPLSRLATFEKAWVAFERMRRVSLGVAAGAGPDDVVPYMSDDQRGNRTPEPGLGRPYPLGVLPPILRQYDGEVGYALPPGWARWVPLIVSGDERTMDGVSAQILGLAGSDFKVKDSLLSPSSTSLADAVGNAIAFANMPDIGLTKPPWWDYRAAAVEMPPGLSERQRDTLLLMRDYVETAKWVMEHVEAPDGDYVKLKVELKKDPPDQAKIDEYVKNLEYARYMMAQTFDFAHKVQTGERPDYSDGTNTNTVPTQLPTTYEEPPINDGITNVAHDPVPPLPDRPREPNKCSARRR